MTTSPPAQQLLVCDLGVVEYRAAMAIQEGVRAQRQAGLVGDVLLTLEHPPVYTRGRRSDPQELMLGADFYSAQGIDVVDTNRGGRITYHGPGQLVVYPIVAITDVVAYLRAIEIVIVAALEAHGVPAQVREGLTGVWVEDRKIASIGVHVSRGVTTHGFAVNVCNDLRPFDWVVPCGLTGVSMTSVSLERGGPVTVASFTDSVIEAFCAVFARAAQPLPAARLGLAATRVGIGVEVSAAIAGADAAALDRPQATVALTR